MPVTKRADGRVARRAAAITVVVSFAVVAVVAGLLVPWAWVPGGHLVPASASSMFTPDQIARAERYSWWQRGLSWTSYAVSLAVLAWFALSATGSRLLHRLTERRRWWLGVPLAALVVVVAQSLLTLPFGAVSHEVDRRYAISHQSFAGWGLDRLTSLAVSWVITTFVLLAVVGFARKSPRWWFAWAGATAMVLTLAGSFLYPVVVEPLFNRFTPMQDGPFKQSILRLADKEGVHVDDVLVADASRRTTTLNAYVSGFGSTRRVVLYDNLLKDLPPRQILVIVAHELGHAKNQDVLLGTTLGAVGSVGAVALLALVMDADGVRRRTRVSGAGDPASVGVLLALAAAGALLVSPLQNTVSRAIETRADRESLAATHADATFVRMQRQLALRSLQDPTPPALSQFWWGTHPTVLQRAGLPASLRKAGD